MAASTIVAFHNQDLRAAPEQGARRARRFTLVSTVEAQALLHSSLARSREWRQGNAMVRTNESAEMSATSRVLVNAWTADGTGIWLT